MSTIPELAGIFASRFTQGTRDDGSKFWKHSEPEGSDLYELCYDAHQVDDMLPDDFVYEFIVDALQLFSEVSDDDECEDAIAEIEGDTYTNDLLTWASSHSGRMGRVNEALNDYYSPDHDTEEYMRYGQRAEKQDIAHSVLESLQKLVEETRCSSCEDDIDLDGYDGLCGNCADKADELFK